PTASTHTRCPRSPPLSPYTTLFRSDPAAMEVATTAHGDIERLDRGRLRIEEHIDARRRAGGEHDVRAAADPPAGDRELDIVERRSEEHTSELQSRGHLVCRLLLAKT